MLFIIANPWLLRQRKLFSEVETKKIPVAPIHRMEWFNYVGNRGNQEKLILIKNIYQYQYY